jgi:hypothetical protein
MGKTPSRRGTRKAATSPTPAGSDSAASTEPLLTIRAQNRRKESVQQVITSGAAAKILRMANHWSYVLRVRTRWAHDVDMREYFGTRAIADLKELDLSADTIQRLASFTHIEIEFHRWEQTGPDAPEVVDAASEIPWEYLLSAATRNAGRFEPLLVTRCLPNNTRVSSTRPPKRVLFVESAPGRIDAEYEFEDEESRIRAAVNATKYRDRMERARTLPLSKLADTVAKSNWEAIHVSGVDTHHAAWLIEGFYDDFKQTEVIDENNYLHDGMILRGDAASEFPIRYNNLAPILLGSPKRPQVVTLNLYYSGARTSRELVRKGAYAALGFLDEIDDEFAERFFQEFYWAWCHHGKPISKAFIDAWQTMDGDRMHGTGIVIWFGSSIVGPAASQR